MSPQHLSARVVGALRLSPMTTTQLATCLTANYWSIKSAINRLCDDGIVAATSVQKRQNVYALRERV